MSVPMGGSRVRMEFSALLEQVVALLQKHGRTTYRALQHQFALDEAARTALKATLCYTHLQGVEDACGSCEQKSTGTWGKSKKPARDWR
jgi:hypothetical protein